MRYFRDYTLHWWQIGILKLCLMAFGLAVGATWPEAFIGWVAVLWIVFVVTAIYMYYVAIRQW